MGKKNTIKIEKIKLKVFLVAPLYVIFEDEQGNRTFKNKTDLPQQEYKKGETIELEV